MEAKLARFLQRKTFFERTVRESSLSPRKKPNWKALGLGPFSQRTPCRVLSQHQPLAQNCHKEAAIGRRGTETLLQSGAAQQRWQRGRILLKKKSFREQAALEVCRAVPVRRNEVRFRTHCLSSAPATRLASA